MNKFKSIIINIIKMSLRSLKFSSSPIKKDIPLNLFEQSYYNYYRKKDKSICDKYDYSSHIHDYHKELLRETCNISDYNQSTKTESPYPICLGEPSNLNCEDRRNAVNYIVKSISSEVIGSIDNTYELNYILHMVRNKYNRQRRKDLSIQVNNLIDLMLKNSNTKAFITIQLKNRANKKHAIFNDELKTKVEKLITFLNTDLYGRNWKEHKNNYLTGYVVYEENKVSKDIHAHICLGEHKYESVFPSRLQSAYINVHKSCKLPSINYSPDSNSVGCLIKEAYDPEGLAIYLTKKFDGNNLDNYYFLKDGEPPSTS